MDQTTVRRQKIMETVIALPDDVLFELANFLDYLCYKSVQKKDVSHSTHNFLCAVAGLGNSDQGDISERDEEILYHEIDPIYGWNLKSHDSV